MPIPDYGIWNDDHTQQILSRDYRFDHAWYSSRKYDPYDNDTDDDIGLSQNPPGPDETTFPNLFYPWPC